MLRVPRWNKETYELSTLALHFRERGSEPERYPICLPKVTLSELGGKMYTARSGLEANPRWEGVPGIVELLTNEKFITFWGHKLW